MTNRIAYLARPIDQAHHASPELHQTETQLTSQLQLAGFHVYRPAQAWRVAPGEGPHRSVEQVNRTALNLADLMVAHLPEGVPSIGVPMEIERAWHLGIPVVVITDADSYALERTGIWRLGDEAAISDGELAKLVVELFDEDQPLVGDLLRPARSDALKLVIADGHTLPQRAYPDDAGIDLTCVKDYVINPGQFVDIHSQVDQVQLPDGFWGLITGRSSTLRKWGLFVPPGIIDPGWRGPLFVGTWNLGKAQVRVGVGTRLGQLILIPNNPAAIVGVDKVDDALRGLAGFGSTDEAMSQ